MRRAVLLVLLIACSKPAKEAPPDPPKPGPFTPPVTAPEPARRFPVTRDASAEGEAWHREITDMKLLSVHGVEARRDDRAGTWQVMVSVMEFVRDVPLEGELRRRIASALYAVPNVTKAVEEDRETWLVTGDARGPALVDAVSGVVDDLAVKAREEIDR